MKITSQCSVLQVQPWIERTLRFCQRAKASSNLQVPHRPDDLRAGYFPEREWAGSGDPLPFQARIVSDEVAEEVREGAWGVGRGHLPRTR